MSLPSIFTKRAMKLKNSAAAIMNNRPIPKDISNRQTISIGDCIGDSVATL
jgi:hypothetical protein